jgi:hypothetical protein
MVRKLMLAAVVVVLAVLLAVLPIVYLTSTKSNSGSTSLASLPIQLSVETVMLPGQSQSVFATIPGLQSSVNSWSLSYTYPNGTILDVHQVLTQEQNYYSWQLPIPLNAPIGNYTLNIRAQAQGVMYSGAASFSVVQAHPED